MIDSDQRAPQGAPRGAVRRLVRTAGALMLARAEFASVELALARTQFMRWLVLALLALLFALLGLITFTALVALVLWPLIGWAALLLPALVYMAGAAWVMQRLMREVDTAPPLLGATLQELASDREALLQAMAGEDAARDDARRAPEPR